MNRKTISFFLLCLFFLGSFSHVNAQVIKPLLLQSGIRTPEANFVTWQQGYTLANERIFNGRFYKVISFAEIPSEFVRTEMQLGGVNLLSYLPVNAYIASISSGFDPAVLSGRGILSITDLMVDERISRVIQRGETPDYALLGDGNVKVSVTLFSDILYSQTLPIIEGLGWEHIHTTGNGRILHMVLPHGELHTLATLPFVQFIEPCDPPAVPDNNRARSLHRATTAFHPGLAPLAYDGTGVTVLLNDDGYVGPHIDFQNRIPYQFTTVTGQDHGDHCAGTILGAGNLDPRAMGMAPAAELIVYRASSYPGFDSIYNQYHTLGIRITSTSYSDGCNAGYTNRAAMLDEQIRTMPELMHVFSAGNNGTQNCGYGAGSGWGNITGGHKMGKNVIAVANVTYSDDLSNSSSRGPAHDGRIKPDVAAQGTQVFSTSEDNTYATKTGTSMACPGTAGTLTLMYDAYNRIHGGTPNGGLMKSILMNTAEDLGNPGPDFRHGYGRINGRRALKVVEDSLWFTDNASQNDSIAYSLTVPAGTKELRVMLYWTDHEGVVNTTKSLVNDLDLLVIGPDSTWLPWVLNHLPNATTLNDPANRLQDTLNNIEQVTLMDPAPGTYQLIVRGSSVPMGPQQFFINYLISANEFLITWPHEGEALEPAETAVIRWDATPGITPFQLEYSTNGGSTWNNIGTAPATDRYFDWNVPSVASGNVQIKLTRGSESHVSTPFTIMSLPQNIGVDWVCIDSLQLSWNNVTAATGYQVMMLGNRYMDSVAYTNTNSVIIHGVPFHTEEWFTVRAYGPDNALSKRPVAIKREPGVINCVYQHDIALEKMDHPEPMIFSSCHTNPPVNVIITVINNGLSTINDFSVHYHVNNGPIVTEQVNHTLTAQQTYQHTFATPIQLLGVNYYEITAWVSNSSDQFPFNDTVQQVISVTSFPVVQIPYQETFESFTLCSVNNGCQQEVCVLSNGWKNPSSWVFDNTDWIAYRGSTPSFWTGPSNDHTLGNGNGKYLYVESSYCFEQEAHVISPCIDLTQASLPVLTFWYHMYGTEMGSLHLDVLSDGVWHYNIMPTLTGNLGNTWRNQMVPLDAYIGKMINLRFRGLTGTNYTSDMAIDDFSIVETVGIEQHLLESSLRMAPNPAKNTVTIAGNTFGDGKITVEVLTLHGQMLYYQNTNSSGGRFHETITVSGWTPGIYMVRITGEDATITRKMVVQRD